MQAALLRVLETQTFRRVGDIRLEHTDVRVLCATCQDLEALVARGAFRQDLYYRLFAERHDAAHHHLVGGTRRARPAASEQVATSVERNSPELDVPLF